MHIKLIKASLEYKDAIMEMLTEWKTDIEVNHTNHSPWVIFGTNSEDFDYYTKHLDRNEEVDGRAPFSTFFCLDTDRDRLVGAVNIRHYLNEDNYLTAGHIGDGIRPSERRKGYATAMIGLALEECRKLGMNKVLMTCNRDNIGSAKSIRNNGGVLESEVVEDGEIEQRYWISIGEETVESDRLILRRLMPMDYQDMAAWTQDARVYKYLLSNPVKKPEDVMGYLRKNDPNSKTRYMMLERSREDGHAIGVMGCVYLKDTDTWDISYNARYEDWGKGYTTEAATAMIAYLSKQYGAHRFEAEFATENVASGRVMEKLGMHFDHASSYTKRDGSVTYESAVYVMEL